MEQSCSRPSASLHLIKLIKVSAETPRSRTAYSNHCTDHHSQDHSPFLSALFLSSHAGSSPLRADIQYISSKEKEARILRFNAQIERLIKVRHKNDLEIKSFGLHLSVLLSSRKVLKSPTLYQYTDTLFLIPLSPTHSVN